MTTLTISAEQVRDLARLRVRLGLAAIPLCLAVAVIALTWSLELMLVAVLAVFFAYAALSVGLRQRRVAREGVGFEVSLDGDRLAATAQPPRRVVRAVDRPDYLRILFTTQRVAAYWLDARRDPDAFIDIPIPRSERGALHAELERAGVPLQSQGSGGRLVALGVGLVAALGAYTVALVVLRLTATAVAASPVTWGLALACIVAMAWVWRAGA